MSISPLRKLSKYALVCNLSSKRVRSGIMCATDMDGLNDDKSLFDTMVAFERNSLYNAHDGHVYSQTSNKQIYEKRECKFHVYLCNMCLLAAFVLCWHRSTLLNSHHKHNSWIWWNWVKLSLISVKPSKYTILKNTKYYCYPLYWFLKHTSTQTILGFC